MKTLETGKDKIKIICDKLRRETLEPSKQEAQNIIHSAKKKADEMIAHAEKQAEQLIKHARAQIEQERNVFHSSLQQSSKQAVEALRQEIEDRVFNEDLPAILDKSLADPKLIAQLINGIAKALEKDGIEADLSVAIPHSISKDQVIALLLDSVKNKLRNQSLEIGSFAGGIQVKLVDKRMTIDLSDEAIKELLSNYARKDFRQIIFSC